ncbi:glycosyltransferase family 9 protein [Desulfosoma caldarium]|uniref:Heptosyltransferase-1 n=1 Tax=Desulfosoma caldarium TaxID=610254 RepID=A0A3N1VTC0_9BACT|nr:glycosyltransferase family 9 protein [Desulfosoma caldarium]ROR03087.1 heptosyltransferase-1 [Desulfosoma caldarium]
MKALALPSCPRFLIIRPSAIGDVVMALPMAATIKKACEDAFVAWIVEPSMVEFLQAQPHVDQVLAWPKSQWKELMKSRRLAALAREVLQFRQRLKNLKIDIALDAQGLLRSRLLAVLSGARHRIGFPSKEPGSFLMTQILSKGPRTRIIATEYEHMMRRLGFLRDAYPMGIFIPKKDTRTARHLVSHAVGTQSYAVFAMFTTRPQKHWLFERWAGLAHKIFQEFGLSVVLLGGPNDVPAGDALARRHAFTVNLAGRTSLLESAAIIQGARLVIGVDTGLTHMAVALKRPTIALFGATCPYVNTRSHHAVVLYKPMHCSPCRRRPTCGHAYTCMAAIQEDDVMSTARRLLDAARDINLAKAPG